MGQNKKVFSEAVSEMKHFLLGAALVLTLVTVVPVLATSHPLGDGGGGGGTPTGDRPVGDQPTGDQQRPTGDQQRPTGDQQRPTGDQQRPTGDQQRPTGDQQRPTGDQQRPPENCPEGETGKPLDCSRATEMRRQRPSSEGSEGRERDRGGRELRESERSDSEDRGMKKERGRRAAPPRRELEVDREALDEAFRDVEGANAAADLGAALIEKAITPLKEAFENAKTKKAVQKLAKRVLNVISPKVIRQICGALEEEEQSGCVSDYKQFVKDIKKVRSARSAIKLLEDLEEQVGDWTGATDSLEGLEEEEEFDDAGMADPGF